jgi:hypothetical protein
MRKVFLSFAVVAVALVVVALVTPQAAASCTANASVSNSGYAVGGYAYQYINFPGNTTGGFLGRFWQTNLPGTQNEGTLQIGNQMFQATTAPDNWFFNFDLAQAGINGCPAGCLTVYIEDPVSGRAIIWTAHQGPDSPNNSLVYNFTYDEFGTVTADHGPRARVTNSARAGTTVNVGFEIPDVAPNVRTDTTPCGTDGSVTARGAYIRQSATAPSTDIAGWTQLGVNAPGAGPADARTNPFDCTNVALDWWLATGVSVGGQSPRFVSSPVRIECDPNLADPTGTFKKIDRPNTGARRQDRD